MIEELRRETKIKKIYIRCAIVIALDDGYTHQQISGILGISEKMVQRVHKLYDESGPEGLTLFYYKGRSGFLTPKQERNLRKELSSHLYKDTREIQTYLLERFNVKMSRSAVNAMLKRLGFVYKKTKVLPGKADADLQRRFAAKLKKLRKQLKETEALYFLDATHPTHNTRAGYGWIEKGKEYAMPSNSGRQRVNINGAMNGVDPTDIQVDFADMVNAQSTICLLEKIEAKNVFKKRIYLIGDNARYYRCKLLKEWLQEHPKFVWMPLPSYSPNLNLIERIWGFMKRERINNFYFDTYQKFKENLMNFFNNLNDYRSDLNRLITYNFQIIDWN